MNDKQIDELIDRALEEEQRLPAGFSERLEGYIDGLAERTCAEKDTTDRDRKEINVSHRSSFRLTLYWISGIAGVCLLCLGLFKRMDAPQLAPPLPDTYTNPQQAAEAATKALVFLSSNLNKGLGEVEKANRNFTEVNGILYKYLKE